jgi:hypothetical protein
MPRLAAVWAAIGQHSGDTQIFSLWVKPQALCGQVPEHNRDALAIKKHLVRYPGTALVLFLDS